MSVFVECYSWNGSMKTFLSKHLFVFYFKDAYGWSAHFV